LRSLYGKPKAAISADLGQRVKALSAATEARLYRFAPPKPASARCARRRRIGDYGITGATRHLGQIMIRASS
jgi:hypothetical protein